MVLKNDKKTFTTGELNFENFFKTTQIVLLVLFYLFISNRILLTVYENDCKQQLFSRKSFVNFFK